MPLNRLSKGELVMVTGATGLIGSSVTEMVLMHGFRVRGVGRSTDEARPFIELLQQRFGSKNFEFTQVKDFTIDGTFAGALIGVSGIVHVAAETNFNPLVETEVALEAVASQILKLMRAAALVPSIKSFVLTSSAAAAFRNQYGPDIFVGRDDYADFVELAKSAPLGDNPFVKALLTCEFDRATKVYGEQMAWKYWRGEKPGYVFNTVLPFWVAGPLPNPTPGNYTSYTWLNEIFLGVPSQGEALVDPANRIVDTRDTAAIHVAALLSVDTNGERLWASGHPWSINQALAIWREAYPERKIREDYPFPKGPLVDLDASKSTALLKELEGRDWISVKDIVLSNVASVL